LKLSTLPLDVLERRLHTTGVYLQTGELVYKITSNVDVVAVGLHQLYGDFPWIEEADFSDFHLDVRQGRSVRRGLRVYAAIRQSGRFETPAFPVDQTLAQFEWSLNRCVLSQFFPRLLIHGGVLEQDGDAVIIVGESGAGKSTLSAALCLNGWRLLSDELTIISPGDGSLTGLARPVALKNDAIDLVKSLSPEAHMGPVSPDTMKGDVAHMRPPAASVHNVGQPAAPACFVFVEYEKGSPMRVQEVPKARAFMDVAQNAALNYRPLGELGFNTLSRAIDSAICLDMRYGDIHEAIDFFGSGSWKLT